MIRTISSVSFIASSISELISIDSRSPSTTSDGCVVVVPVVVVDDCVVWKADDDDDDDDENVVGGVVDCDVYSVDCWIVDEWKKTKSK